MWLELLKTAVKNQNIQLVADQMQISRSYVSRVFNGHIPVDEVSPRFVQRVLDTFGSVQCPHLDREISLNECRTNHQSAVPTSSPRAMKLWQACQGCPHNHQGSGHANANS